MTYTIARKALAFALLVALAACSGAGSTGSGAPTGVVPDAGAKRPASLHPHTWILANIVGVGDSLTAGYQSNGFLGQPDFKDPLDTKINVPPNQENGWWADLYEQAAKQPIQTSIDDMYDPAKSPLPLIAAPGLNDQLIPTGSVPPFNYLKAGNGCTAYNGFDAKGYLLSGLSVVRMNPTTKPHDLGVPGITLHEANVLAAPQSSTCESIPGVPGLLSAVVAGESSTFWSVLGTFAAMGSSLSEVHAAASLHPTLATVWLGANDLLKYMGSGGIFVGGDNTVPQVQSDLIQTIQTLQYAGAHTVVANLPNILYEPYFMQVNQPKSTSICYAQTYLYCVMATVGITGPMAVQLTKEIAAPYHLQTTSCVPASTTSPCGYLTLGGALDSLQYYLADYPNVPNLDCEGPNFTKPCVPGSGLGGYYITPAFAGKIQALNNVINTGINNAAAYTQSGLVDVATIFAGIASGDPSNPYYAQAISINPGVCCTASGGAPAQTGKQTHAVTGLVSFDGLHPSNTGYALVAYYFIKTINARYATKIPEIDISKAYAGTRCSNKLYCFPDVYAPHAAGANVIWDSLKSQVHALGLDRS